MDEDPFRGRSLAASKAKRFERPGAAPAPAPAEAPAPRREAPEASGRMADVGGKPIVARMASAEGFLRLKPETVTALREGTAPKGDPFPVARVAGILAAKRTPDIVPLCHPIPLTAVDVACDLEPSGVRVHATVRAQWLTGVEMEALAACTAALLTVWDMTKALEKDETGNYPDTSIESIRVTRKVKGV